MRFVVCVYVSERVYASGCRKERRKRGGGRGRKRERCERKREAGRRTWK